MSDVTKGAIVVRSGSRTAGWVRWWHLPAGVLRSAADRLDGSAEEFTAVTTQSKATAALLRAVADLAAPDLHVSTGVPEDGQEYCRECAVPWPCRVERVIAAGEELARWIR